MIEKLLQTRAIRQKHIFLFLLFWLIVNVLQAVFTELHYDEAYYWYYSLNLDWGYFDHPPMVALMSKIGDTFFHSRLSVRLLSVLMGVFVMWQLIKYLKDDADNLAYLLIFILSFPLISLHSAGFLLLPDAPLVFFFMIYLWIYKRFLEDDSWLNSLIFAVVAAAMMYSKYHASIIILLTILSNPKLLKNIRFWVLGMIAVILFLPHLYWQYDNGFPTFLYHLSDRGGGFEFANLLNYVGSQIALAGLLGSVLVIWLTFKYQYTNQFEKTLKYIAIGFWVFFLLLCFKGKVEAHWTSASIIAVIIVSFKALQKQSKLKKIILYLMIPGASLLFLARILLASDTLADQFSIKSNFHNYTAWVAELDSLSQGHPILFVGGYKDVSRYGFYKNKEMPQRSYWWSRSSQYENKTEHIKLAGQTVFAFDYRTDMVWTSKNGNPCQASFIEDYYPYYGLKMVNHSVRTVNDSIFFCFELENTSGRDFEIMHDSLQRLGLVNRGEYLVQRAFLDVLNTDSIIANGAKIPYQFFIKPDEGEEELFLHVILHSGRLRITQLRPQTFPVMR